MKSTVILDVQEAQREWARYVELAAHVLRELAGFSPIPFFNVSLLLSTIMPEKHGSPRNTVLGQFKVTAGQKLWNDLRLPARGCAEQPEARAQAGEDDGNHIGGCLLSGTHRPMTDECHLLNYNGSLRDYARNFEVELCQQKCQQRSFE